MVGAGSPVGAQLVPHTALLVLVHPCISLAHTVQAAHAPALAPVQPLARYHPAWHVAHTRHLVWPCALWYVPGGHGWHSLDVVLGLYVPTGQGVHTASDVARQEAPQLVPAGQVLHGRHSVPP